MLAHPYKSGDWNATPSMNASPQSDRLPKKLIWGIWLVCIVPFLLNLAGFSFAARIVPYEPELYAANTPIDLLYATLNGSFTHTILEWSAFCTAIFTVVLAFTHFRLRKDVTTPVIGVALLCAGVMDAFHTLAADRLIEAVADNQDLIPFTWAICRLANVSLTLLGVSIFLLLKHKKWMRSIYVILGISSLFCVLSYGVINVAATSYHLPRTIYPDALITRPWDVAPLCLFLVAGIFIYPRFYRAYPSVFSHALIISTIPNIATQLFMAFGSKALFDNAFNIGHFLKIIAYLVPLAGLIYDYYITYQKVDLINRSLNLTVQEQTKTAIALRESEQLLRQKNQELEAAFASLKEAQTQLIQTEKMSSLGQMVAGVAHEINNPVNFIHGNLRHLQEHFDDLLALVELYEQEYDDDQNEAIAELTEEIDLDFLQADIPKMFGSMRAGSDRIRAMVLSLRNFSRLDEADLKSIDILEGLESTLTILNHRLKQQIIVEKNYSDIPAIACYPAQLNQVWMNLISNALDAMDEQRQGHPDFKPQLSLHTGSIDADHIHVAIADNGPGIPEIKQRKIFDPFFTTKPIGKGTGLGLAIVYQIVEKHHGKIELESSPEKGTIFRVILPIRLAVVT